MRGSALAATAERRHVQQLMGMPITLALRGRHTSDETALAAWSAVVTELRWVDWVFSTWKPASAISKLARGEIPLAQCPPEVAEVLALGEQAEAQSDGAFTLRPHGLLDPTGVVKGWGVDRAARQLQHLPDTDWCLSAGGDMVCRTGQRNASPWRIGIENPADPRSIIATVPLHDGAIATSGSTHRGSHLVDGRTGLAPRGISSVTVVAPTLTTADLDATAAYAMGADGAEWLAARGRTYFIVLSDGTKRSSNPPTSSTSA
jgi:FAD:protein FMN transferase